MRIGRRIVKVLFWGAVLCLSIVVGGLWFAYWYLTDGDTIAQLIRERAVRFFPGSTLDPGRVHISLTGAEVAFRNLKLIQRIDGQPFETLAVPYLKILIDAKKLTNGQLEAREVVVSQPNLRLRRRHDGRWNLEGILADPWPGPWIETPPITVLNGTLELIPDEEPTNSDSCPQDAAETLPIPAPPMIAVSQVSDDSRLPASAAASPYPVGPARAAVKHNPSILRNVTLNIKGRGDGSNAFEFEGTALGDVFEKLRIKGTADLLTGMVTLEESELTALTLSENLRRRIPREARTAVKSLALNSGVADIDLNHLQYNPAAPPGNRLHYQASARLREGVWDCPNLPFSVNDLSAVIGVANGILTIKHAQGSNGLTSMRAEGTMALGDPMQTPLDLQVFLNDLELDKRLRDRTPAEYQELWDVFKPRGRPVEPLRHRRIEAYLAFLGADGFWHSAGHGAPGHQLRDALRIFAFRRKRHGKGDQPPVQERHSYLDAVGHGEPVEIA